MAPIFLGIDVAGKDNTWMAGISRHGGSLEIVCGPELASLQKIVAYCDQYDVLAVAVDAQLTAALSDENGFRSSDNKLRSYLSEDCRNWIASINSLMAVPIRGRLLADALSPLVGTILETHPRASLYLGLPQEDATERTIRNYKSTEANTKDEVSASIQTLWRAWSMHFRIIGSRMPQSDGELDAIVCATAAYLFHNAPDNLVRLKHTALDKTGRGPFYVVAMKG